MNRLHAKKRGARSQQRTDNAKHPWREGELCTAVYNNLGEGLIYRVTGIVRAGNSLRPSPLLKVIPIFGVVADPAGRMPRTLDACYCTPTSLVDLATMYAKFGLFISEESRRFIQEPEVITPPPIEDDDQGI